jgi:toxin ParE1/3/4
LAAEASEAAATRWLEKLPTTFDAIREFPLGGPSREHLAEGLRIVFQGKYAVYYRVTAYAIVVVRVLHGARDVAAIADAGGFEER